MICFMVAQSIDLVGQEKVRRAFLRGYVRAHSRNICGASAVDLGLTGQWHCLSRNNLLHEQDAKSYLGIK